MSTEAQKPPAALREGSMGELKVLLSNFARAARYGEIEQRIACAEKIEQHFQALREEVEGLRRDSERYRWLRAQHWTDDTLAVVMNPRDNVKLGSHLPSGTHLDAAIDTALAATRKTDDGGEG